MPQFPIVTSAPNPSPSDLSQLMAIMQEQVQTLAIEAPQPTPSQELKDRVEALKTAYLAKYAESQKLSADYSRWQLETLKLTLSLPLAAPGSLHSETLFKEIAAQWVDHTQKLQEMEKRQAALQDEMRELQAETGRLMTLWHMSLQAPISSQ